MNGAIFELQMEQSKFSPKKNTFSTHHLVGKTFVLNNGNEALGSMTFSSDMKVEIRPSKKQSGLFIITGNFKNQQFLIIQKAENSRKQDLIGDCAGKTVSKKGLLESTYLASLAIETGLMQPLLFAGVVLLCSMS